MFELCVDDLCLWVIVACPQDLASPFLTLPLHARCHIPHYCSGFSCCVHDEHILHHHFTVGIRLDDCNHLVTIQLEKIFIEIPLVNCTFGIIPSLTDILITRITTVYFKSDLWFGV